MTRDLKAALIFYAIAFGLSLLVALATSLLGGAGELATMLTPLTVVVAMIVFATRTGEWRAAVAGLGLGRLGLKAWPVALTILLLIEFGAVVLLAAIGLTAIAMPPSQGLMDMVSNVVAGLTIMTIIAAFEEVGWRGYMLPRMMGLGPVRAMLIVGFLHGLWHMPLLLTTDLYHAEGNPWIVVPMFLVTLTLAGAVYGALRRERLARGSGPCRRECRLGCRGRDVHDQVAAGAGVSGRRERARHDCLVAPHLCHRSLLAQGWVIHRGSSLAIDRHSRVTAVTPLASAGWRP